ncbi:PREDICTED: ribonucleases P/MRP protein subunit POP1-like isoform X1 [Branchiostoma belcheri]|uniref:Ribonucleases P/MRP protein subunit POP1-like isoform X1 n=1 Tax=Branchiostoma belcheri TaxID=7741 RepID=A0A6P4ZC68_BRABE|nr:PREDICTED: ribonucleases P/MRP protein subunit POP1-like isoform X1 [Branchiostoma belcheri]
MSSSYNDGTPGSATGNGQQPTGHLSRQQKKFRRRHVGSESTLRGSPVPSPLPAAATPGTGATPSVVMAPRGLTVMQFMEARAVELNSLLHLAQKSYRSKHTVQSLPRHMRRRAVSHNPKRLPRRLREAATKKMLRSMQPGQQMEKPRRPRKWYRQRAANRQAEYARRQNHVTWLETHVWHAKRFHMVNRWGYRLPDYPCDKSQRAAYRAMCHHCLIQDISYYGCIELTGSKDNILSLLAHFTHLDKGGSISMFYSEGKVEGTAILYRRDSYPNHTLGPVTYMFRPQTENSKDTFATSSCQLWLWTHPACTQDILQELQQGMSDTSVRVQSIGDELVRFQLTGQLAAATLESALNLPPLQNETVRPGQVLSLTVVDPRLNMPSKRTKVTPLTQEADPAELKCDTGLWDAERRKTLQTPSGQDSRSIEKRDVAGDDGPVTGDNRCVPILLVHQQGRTAASALGTGWDVIVPAGWAMAFWLGFLYRGARAGGLREMRRLHLETGQLFFPDDFPDTEAYRTFHQEQAAQLREQHDRYPPGKRPNFVKLGTAAPFHCPWDRLMEGWTQVAGTSSPGQPQGLCVVRDSRIRQQLSQLCSHGNHPDLHLITPLLAPVLTNLVAVQLRMVSRGTPVAMAMICAPTEEDVSGCVSCDPVEPTHTEGTISHDCDVVRHCSRLTMGYVTAGANSLSVGQGVGTGLCVVQGLLAALQVQQHRQPPVVLVRNPNSAQYRFAHITVL